MKTLKFQNYREKRQELFDVDNYKFKTMHFIDGGERRVYGNANLSIFTDDYCNADCIFCVAQLRYESQLMTYKKDRIRSDEEYFRRLEEVLDFLYPINLSVSITGGEPTKSHRLVGILKLIEKYDYRKRTLTTNGSGLLDLWEGKEIIHHIADNGFQHLNISRAHWNEERNSNIMRYETGHFSNKNLEDVINICKVRDLRPRMSCVLLKSGVKDMDDIIEYLETYQNLGIDNVIFRELMDYDPSKMKNLPKMNYCKENKVYLNDIWKVIDNDPRFEKIDNLLGYYYYVEIYKYKNIDMCSESANLVKLYDEKEKSKDVVFEMVFHPNGNLNGSWVDDEDILDKYPGKV